MAHDRFVLFEGSHAGFERLTDPATHRRVMFGVFGRFFLVLDRLVANGGHRIDARYHFASGLNASVAADGGIVVSHTGDATPPIADVCILGRGVDVQIERGRVAPSYAAVREAPVLVVSATGSGTQDLATIFVHRHGASNPVRIRELPARGGRLVSLVGAGGEDIIGWGEAGIVSDSIDCDARWLWIRRDHEGMRDAECVLVGGSKLVVDGRVIASLTHASRFVVGRLRENGWQLDTGAPRADR